MDLPLKKVSKIYSASLTIQGALLMCNPLNIIKILYSPWVYGKHTIEFSGIWQRLGNRKLEWESD